MFGSGALFLCFLFQAANRHLVALVALVFLSCLLPILGSTPAVLGEQRKGKTWASAALGAPSWSRGIESIESCVPTTRGAMECGHSAAGSPHSHVTHEFGMMDGDVKTCQEKLEELRKDVGHSSAQHGMAASSPRSVFLPDINGLGISRRNPDRDVATAITGRRRKTNQAKRKKNTLMLADFVLLSQVNKCTRPGLWREDCEILPELRLPWLWTRHIFASDALLDLSLGPGANPAEK
jgi:hypothetical protein